MPSLWTPSGERFVSGPADATKLAAMASSALHKGRIDGPIDDSADRAEMRANRRINAKLARRDGMSKEAALTGAPSQLSFATGRPQDPMFYWRQTNLPYDIWKEEELIAIRHYARLIYLTHPVLASAIDIFSKYPLVGMEPACKDDALVDFYGTLFMDDLNYEEFLPDVLHEHWTVGEALPLGQWNESLGVWEDDELMNPDDVKVIKSPFLKEPRFEMRLPETLREIIQKREPKWEFDRLVKSYPELVHFANQDAYMPVSNELLKQLRFKADVFHPRGIPIMMRIFRSIYQEEMLNAAQDAIASRLYTPLILVRLGASATDLGTTQPWIPDSQDLENFEEALDAALAADFRVLTHHFATQVDSVFGKEAMPDFTPDFERLIDRQLQAFGMSRTMLNGAEGGETYAADALNRDVMSQLLVHAQKLVQRFWRQRCLVVAEAQEHFDYEVRGGKRYPIMEEVLEVDEETGAQKIVQQPKLLVPELRLKSMSMQDEEQQRQFLELLRSTGVPISMKTRLVNCPIDLQDEMERCHEEQVELAVEAQRVRKDTYLELQAEGLPIPEDLQRDFVPMANGSPEAAPSDGGIVPVPTLGLNTPAPTTALVPTQQDLMLGEQMQAQQGAPLGGVLGQGAVPPESNEMRAGMPRASRRRVAPSLPVYQELRDDDGEWVKFRVTSAKRVVQDDSLEGAGEVIEKEAEITEVVEGPGRLISGPARRGRRRLDPSEPLEED